MNFILLNPFWFTKDKVGDFEPFFLLFFAGGWRKVNSVPEERKKQKQMHNWSERWIWDEQGSCQDLQRFAYLGCNGLHLELGYTLQTVVLSITMNISILFIYFYGCKRLSTQSLFCFSICLNKYQRCLHSILYHQPTK